jgi:hypothetical protein
MIFSCAHGAQQDLIPLLVCAMRCDPQIDTMTAGEPSMRQADAMSMEYEAFALFIPRLRSHHGG